MQEERQDPLSCRICRLSLRHDLGQHRCEVQREPRCVFVMPTQAPSFFQLSDQRELRVNRYKSVNSNISKECNTR